MTLTEQAKWHTCTAAEALAALAADPRGLAQEEAQARQRQVGPNQLEERQRASLLTMFFDQFRNFMVIVLLAATLISGLLGEMSDAVTIIVIVFANGILGFFQELKAERSLASLRQLTAPTAHVLRADSWCEIPARELVPGDVIELFAGDRVPADARLLRADELATEESSLTGESLPVGKNPVVIHDPEALVGDRRNMVYMGTMVTRGKAEALVVATGMATEMGQIAHLIAQSEESATPLEHRLNQLGRMLVYMSLLITLIVVLAGVVHGHALYEMFLAGVSLAVAAIPEGLPAIVTIALALGVQRMIRRRAIVRRLPAVETLGCATVICSDKTGTLTQNQMTVKEIRISGRTITVEGDGYAPVGRLLEGVRPARIADAALARLLQVCLTCNNARLVHAEGQYASVGDPTEAALLTLVEKAGYADESPRVAEFPFDSERKRMSVAIREQDGLCLLVKGAPDLLLPRCTHVLTRAGVRPLDAQERERLDATVRDMAGRALRTLGVAFRTLDRVAGAPDEMERGLTFVGLVGMIDPPRPEVKDAIAKSARAGIRTVMITGDHRLTAVAIAKDLGILPETGRVMTGEELTRLSERELVDAVDGVYVFARVSPLHKLQIVRALQSRGHVVAMTGDGVNDAPAIKASDIGIAMGKGGTDVAKDASALILADDNFATIVAAIEEGRGIYDNIRKFIRYLLTSNTGEIVTMFLAMVAGLPLPLLPIQILWVNLVTDGLPAIALGVDSPEDDTMERPPRHIREGIFARGLGRRILTRGVLIGLATLAVFYGSWKWGPGGLQTAQTMAFATLVMAQLIHVFDCRSVMHGVFERGVFGNLWLVSAVISSLLLLLAVIYIPWLRPIFHTDALGAGQWIAILAAASVPTFTVQMRRRRRRSRQRPATA